MKNIPAIYQRSKRIHISSGQQSLLLEGETEGEGASVTLEEFIDRLRPAQPGNRRPLWVPVPKP
ncbi:MAG: hypothetical protein H6557_04455 [Lewinellaceae bacterium]|nr:hypothetical protein [Lewinellaceae bacterium]